MIFLFTSVKATARLVFHKMKQKLYDCNFRVIFSINQLLQCNQLSIINKKEKWSLLIFFFSLIAFCLCLDTAVPTQNNYFRSGSQKFITGFDLIQSRTFIITFASPFQQGTPLVTFALKQIRNEQVADQSNGLSQGFSLSITILDSMKLQIEFKNTQGIYNLAISYLGVENNYPRNIYFINSFAFPYLKGYAFPNEQASKIAFTYLVNYTVLAGTNSYNKFTGQSKIILFLSAFQSTQNIGQVNYWISDGEHFSIEVTPKTNLLNIDKLEFNIIVYDDSEVSNYIVAPSLFGDSFITVNGDSETTISIPSGAKNQFIMGLIQVSFQKNDFACAIDFKWMLKDGTNDIIIGTFSEQASVCGSFLLETAYFYVKSLGCQDPYKYYNRTSQLCQDQCQGKTTLKISDSTCVNCPYYCQTCEIVGQQFICLTCNSQKGRIKNGNICQCKTGTTQSLISQTQLCVQCSQSTKSCQQCTTDSVTNQYNCTKCAMGHTLDQTNYVCRVICTGKQNSLGNVISATQCDCITPFIWNFDFFQCWRNCQAIENSPKVSASLTTCACNPGFQWNIQLQKCVVNCSFWSGATGVAISDLVCQCNPGFIWYLSQNLCAINCRRISNSPKTPSSSTECNCNQGFYWDTTRQLCQYNCSGILNSPGTYMNDEECNCNEGLVWNRTVKKCLRDCSNDIYALDAISDIACACKQNFIWNVDQRSCWVNCSLGFNTNPTLYKKNQCLCVFGDHKFYLNLLQCSYNCSLLQRTTGNRIATGQCECQRGYTGVFCNKKDCTAIAYSQFNVGPDENSCSCRYLGYSLLWNSQQQRCTRPCQQQRLQWPGQLEAYCSCPQGQSFYPYGFYFNSIWNSMCLLNCNQLANSFQVPDQTRCLCKFGYRYVKTIHQCVRICTHDPYSYNGQYINQNTCQCISGYYFNQEFSLCQKNCSNVPNSKGITKNTNACQCNQGFFYSLDSQSCSINCLAVEKSKKQNDDINSCKCYPGYIWSRTIRNCIFDCAKVQNSIGVTAEDNETCFCSQGYEWNREMQTCQSISVDSGTILAIVLGSIVGLLILGLLSFLIYKLVAMANMASQTKDNHQKVHSSNSLASQSRTN